MKYLQNGGFQENPLFRLTLGLTSVLLAGFIVTNFLLYFGRMDLTPSSVVSYYMGSEADFQPARSYQSMLEVSHGHSVMIALVLLLLTHLLIFTSFSKKAKLAFILVPFTAAILNEASSWLVRFVAPELAMLKIVGFAVLQISLIVLLIALLVSLLRAKKPETITPPVVTHAQARQTQYQARQQGQRRSTEQRGPGEQGGQRRRRRRPRRRRGGGEGSRPAQGPPAPPSAPQV